MLQLEILDQIERANRWRGGPVVRQRGRFDLWFTARPSPQGYAGSPGVGGGNCGAAWISSNDILLCLCPQSETFQTYRYVLSTDTLTQVSASIGAAMPTYMAQELNSGGIVWMIGRTSTTWYLYRFNAANWTWTQVLTFGGQPLGFQYGPNMTLYCHDGGANSYALVNGTAQVVSNPNLLYPLSNTIGASLRNKAGHGWAASPYIVFSPRHPSTDSVYPTLDDYPLAIHQPSTSSLLADLLIPSAAYPLALSMSTASYLNFVLSGTATNPITIETPTNLDTHLNLRAPFMVPLYNMPHMTIIGWGLTDAHRMCYAIDCVMYDAVSNRVLTQYPRVLLPSRRPTSGTILSAPIPQAARDCGTYISLYMFVPNTLTSVSYASRFVEIMLPH